VRCRIAIAPLSSTAMFVAGRRSCEDKMCTRTVHVRYELVLRTQSTRRTATVESAGRLARRFAGPVSGHGFPEPTRSAKQCLARAPLEFSSQSPASKIHQVRTRVASHVAHRRHLVRSARFDHDARSVRRSTETCCRAETSRVCGAATTSRRAHRTTRAGAGCAAAPAKKAFGM
jgi:hypothetical protein